MTVWKDNNTLRPRRLTEENLNSMNKSKKVVAKNKKHLKQLIDERLARFGRRCDLNDIDVSQITDMSDLFNGSAFKGEIGRAHV